MSDNTAISWTDATWNPLRGCTKVSEGCRFCYAMGGAYRFAKEGEPYAGLAHLVNGRPEWTGEIMLVEGKLIVPVRWRKPRKIFVNSMSDLFHEKVPLEYLDRVFASMLLGRQHIYQVLTKRPERMQAYMGDPETRWRVIRAAHETAKELPRSQEPALGVIINTSAWPLRHVWLGTSVESNAVLHRVSSLARTPAAVRFLSCEPLLETLTDLPSTPGIDRIDWIICGGESGRHLDEDKWASRAMPPEAARHLRDLAVCMGIPFWMKQHSHIGPGYQPFIMEEDGRETVYHQFPPQAAGFGGGPPLGRPLDDGEF